MPEETPQLPVSETAARPAFDESKQEVQIEAPSFFDKLKLQKKRILISLGSFLGVLLLAGAVWGAYLIGQRQTKPTLQPTPTPEFATPTPDPTADWQTYTNTEYGYSIKYPREWDLVEPGSNGEGSIALQNYLESQVTEEEKQNVRLNPDKIAITIGIYEEIITEDGSLLDWLKAHGHYESTMQGIPESIEETTIGGHQALKLSYPATGVFYNFTSGKYVFYSYFNPKDSSYASTFDLILSTFRFDQLTTGKFLEEENFESRKVSLLNAINTYLEALIVDKDWEKAKSYLSASAYIRHKDANGPSRYVSYEILNEYHSTEEEMNFYNQQEPTFDVKFYEDDDPTGTRVSIKFFQENGEWKTNAWFSKE